MGDRSRVRQKLARGREQLDDPLLGLLDREALYLAIGGIRLLGVD